MSISFSGRLLAICIAPSKKTTMQCINEATVVEGQGLQGDRYAQADAVHAKAADPSQEVTLIEQEAIDAAVRDYKLDISHRDTRRNLLTKGVPLNHLVGQVFNVGEVTLRGIELCEPCKYLESMTVKGIERALAHRGGLRAQIVKGGVIRVGDAIEPVDI